MLVFPLVKGEGATRPIGGGDLVGQAESIATLTTAGAGSILGTHLASSILRRTGPGSGYTDTFAASTDILAALSGNLNLNPAGVTFSDLYIAASQSQPGSTYRWLFINGVAQAMTAAVTAGAGTTLGSNVNVAASLWREYLITLVNTSQNQAFNCTTTSGSAAVTGLSLAQTVKLSVGMTVQGTGVTNGTTIASIQPDVGFTMSANATADGLAALSFYPSIVIAGLRSGTA